MTTLSGAAGVNPKLSAVRASHPARRIAVVCAPVAALAMIVVTLVMRGSDREVTSTPHVTSQTIAAAADPAYVAPAGGPAEPSPAMTPHSIAAPSTVEPQSPAAPEARAVPPPSIVQSASPSPPTAPSAPVAVAELQAPRAPGVAVADIPPAEPATIEFSVESTPAGAQVLLDGAMLGKTPFHGTLPRQARNATLVLRLAGYLDHSVVVHPDKPITERLELVRAPPKPLRTPRGDRSVNPFAK
jgi:hypothetical protein